ncbi:cytochrome c-type biogenesis protein [Chthonobacter albigriseus]|uniref:cytochrome c-type biogenesis protein n=1 Tax=Chthonobacter albigriseus TaxID=1683161 RepID=UPI0015EF034C|nr:cytochrome c-type biogenesis protein [Chthonobacter albigriseus]
MRRRLAAFAVLAALAGGPALAVQPSERLPDPAQEARARALSTELRCMVCQNQSIDDSDAQLAKDLRVLVRERISAGDSDAEVLDYLVDRYGEFVLLKPRFKSETLVLWLTAPAILILGGGVAFLAYRRRAARAAATPEPGLSAEETRALDRILAGDAPAER